MKEHTISWFESDDGKIFMDEMECYNYELNVLYRKSGVVFYIRDKRVDSIDTEDDRTYNDMTDIFIDRSKTEENEAFYKFMHDNYGWCLVEEALEGTGSHYRFNDSSFEPILEVSEKGCTMQNDQ